MRSLVESILDDDDKLFKDAKQSIDPFEVFVNAVDSGMSKYEISGLLNDGLFNAFVENELYLDREEFFWSVMTYSDHIVSITLESVMDTRFYPVIIRYRKNVNRLEVELYKFKATSKYSTEYFDYNNYKKSLSNFRKRGFKKSNNTLDKIGNYNTYYRKTK